MTEGNGKVKIGRIEISLTYRRFLGMTVSACRITEENGCTIYSANLGPLMLYIEISGDQKDEIQTWPA